MPRGYVPERGDVVWITLTPQAGHEQAGRRPAIVLSPASYNGKVGLAILCPITSHVKDYPFEVAIPDQLPVKGVILCDQVKSLDWKARKTERICELPDFVVLDVLARLRALLRTSCVVFQVWTASLQWLLSATMEILWR